MLCASYTPMRAAIKLGNPNVLPTLLRGGASNCIAADMSAPYKNPTRTIRHRGRPSPTKFDSLCAERAARTESPFSTYTGSPRAGGYRKYERTSSGDAAVARRRPSGASGRTSAALEIWVSTGCTTCLEIRWRRGGQEESNGLCWAMTLRLC